MRPYPFLLIPFGFFLLLPWPGSDPAARGGHGAGGAADPALAALVARVRDAVAILDEETGWRHRPLHRRLAAAERRLLLARRLPERPATRVRATVKRSLDRISARVEEGFGGFGRFGSPTIVRQDRFGIRTEPEFGTPACPQADVAEAHCTVGPWLSTTSPNFFPIRKEAFLRGESSTPQGIRMTASFVAERDFTDVAVVFSAEAYTDTPGKRMFVRALLDDEPADPPNVVFAAGPNRGTRTFAFTARVDAGIHTVEIQWRVDPEARAYLRDGTLLVRTGRGVPSARGSLVTTTVAGQLAKDDAGWSDILGMDRWIYVPDDGVLTASFSAESAVTGGKALVVRAVIDGGELAAPSNVVFGRAGGARSRTATFGAEGLAKGWHRVRFQWAMEAGGEGFVADRSMVLAAYPSPFAGASHVFVSPPSGPSLPPLGPVGLFPMPHMSTDVVVPATGNGEVAVQFSGEMTTPSGDPVLVVLAVDGVILNDTLVEITDGADAGEVRTHLFEAKGLAPGSHEVRLWWGLGAAGEAAIGDRILAVTTETGFIPDLAEAPRFGGGHIGVATDRIDGIEPLVGTLPVLAVLWDHHRCDAGGGRAPGEPEDCNDPPASSIPPHKVRWALFGLEGYGDGDIVPNIGDFVTNNVRSYFLGNSGGRFAITNAGVVGWVDALKPAAHYFSHANTCAASDDDFTDGSIEFIAEALKLADPAVDFSAYDVNADGRLDNHELGIVIVVPRPSGDGSSLQPIRASQCPDQMLVLDGVTLPRSAVKWNTSLDDDIEELQFTTAAHEIMHLFAGLDDLHLGRLRWRQGKVVADGANTDDTFATDLSAVDNDRWVDTRLTFTGGALDGESQVIASYAAAGGVVSLFDPFSDTPAGGDPFDLLTLPHATYPEVYSLMASNRRTTTHLDPLYKLALGWVTPRIVHGPGTYPVETVGASDRVYILPRYNHGGGEEFFVLENRQADLPGLYDAEIDDSGLAVWHVVSDMQDNLNAPIGVPKPEFDAANRSSSQPASKGQQGRRGIRLLRPFDTLWSDGAALFSDTDNDLWDTTDYTLDSAPCPVVFLGPQFFYPNTLTWADCSPSGYRVEHLSPAQPVMSIHITVP